MEKRQIVNIINFIRGVEPREPRDLITPVKEQIKLLKQYNLKGTFLIQYDALLNPQFSDLLAALDSSQFELGVWFEVVQPLAEQAGCAWRGRFPWDWHAHCGFSVGYPLEKRRRMIDILFEAFKVRFGAYPKAFGSWAFDAETLSYASETYGLDAACNCKDQWGTDGYALWGGYYGQAYYPSRENAFCPAQSRERQIDTPVFRMLGSDPVCQYDIGLDVNAQVPSFQGVATLEPVYRHVAGGGMPEWVDWYLSQNFSGNCVTFGYAQAGQENSFGWPDMSEGLKDQFAKFAKLQAEGKLTVETLGESGRWFKSAFAETPPSSIAALKDWKEEERRSVWYDCKNYRMNVYAKQGRFWIRDWYLFREDYRERYLDDHSLCTGNELTYDNLPVVDGNRFSGGGIRGGLYLSDSDTPTMEGMPYQELTYREEDGGVILTFTGTPCGEVTVTMTEQGIVIAHTKGNLYLHFAGQESSPAFPSIQQNGEKELCFCYRGYSYSITLAQGFIENRRMIRSEEGAVRLRF